MKEERTKLAVDPRTLAKLSSIPAMKKSTDDTKLHTPTDYSNLVTHSFQPMLLKPKIKKEESVITDLAKGMVIDKDGKVKKKRGRPPGSKNRVTEFDDKRKKKYTKIETSDDDDGISKQ